MRPRSATAPTARATLYQINEPFPSEIPSQLWYSRNSSEHALEDGKQNIRNLGAADRWRRQDILHTKVRQVTDETASRVGEGQRVTPEEPLEGDHADRHDGQPYQREGRLAASETGVEETMERRVSKT